MSVHSILKKGRPDVGLILCGMSLVHCEKPHYPSVTLDRTLTLKDKYNLKQKISTLDIISLES